MVLFTCLKGDEPMENFINAERTTSEYSFSSCSVLSEAKESQSGAPNISSLFVTKGCPTYIRSDNGSEFTANALKNRLFNLDVNTYII